MADTKPDVREVDESFLVAIDMDTGQALVPLSDYSALVEENKELKRKLAECQEGK